MKLLTTLLAGTALAALAGCGGAVQDANAVNAVANATENAAAATENAAAATEEAAGALDNVAAAPAGDDDKPAEAANAAAAEGDKE